MTDPEGMKQYSWFTAKIYSLIVKSSRDAFVINKFMEYVNSSKTVLELGSGTGKDFSVFSKKYKITGSDYSDVFLKILRKKFKECNFHKLNALTMDIEDKYDVIYSNKVLQHLKPKQLEASLKEQYRVLNNGGILFHTIWKGLPEDKKTNRIPNVLYTKEYIERIKGDFSIIDYIEYKEFEENDSFIIILKKLV